jgi:hypothetical protein
MLLSVEDITVLENILFLFSVTENGVIPESILVFTVKKSATTVDYHDNIDQKKFRRWTETLLSGLNKTNEKFIIVMVTTDCTD